MKAQPVITQLQNYLNLPEVQDLLQDIAAPEENVQQWLGNLALLNNVPFQNIIADTRLLPQESLRFFYVDPSWIDALMDGALSVGSDTSLDMMFTEIMANVAKVAGVTIANQIRAGLIGIEPENQSGILPDPNNLMSGLLFRSAIVADWPGLQIIPSYANSSVSPVPLRFEKIGADIILIIFPAIPEQIIIRQPSHAIVFGVEDGENPPEYNIYLRSIGQGSYSQTTGQEISSGSPPEPVPVTVNTGGQGFFRQGNYNVVDIAGLQTTLQNAMINNNALPAGTTLSPSEFAMQLVKSPEEVTFASNLASDNKLTLKDNKR